MGSDNIATLLMNKVIEHEYSNCKDPLYTICIRLYISYAIVHLCHGAYTGAKLMIDTVKLGSLSKEAQEVVKGMISHCLSHHICMGMDEGFKRDGIKHGFRLEIESLIE